ncbi:hypothetical protein HWV62_25044 [Athelia sp. TMB]|nr:hypothetical protein HWV62_25044 [Athelia sp. TMB]
MGVKSLWNLLTPVGRPVLLETIENKTLAIDSSIWLYQFQATMRDKEGRALTNAHVLGFLRRICKLLFYGIRPVFVFDGGAPVLKRSTIMERKKKKKGAVASHARIAEKLLAAQMRREALEHAHPAPASSKEKAPAVIDENTVYLEDIDPSHPRTPYKAKAQADESPSSSSKKTPKARFHDHDPYRLPPAPLPSITSSVGAVDPRLATDEELRSFINEMRPSDLDLDSPAFLALPTEAQYELVRDLRFRSRQPSHAIALANSPDPLAFSRAQIRGVGERNRLTQTLLAAGGGGGHGAIRIAGERNREYVLVRSEGKEGGWVLGLRNTGTREKPIEVDEDEDEKEDEKEEIEEVDFLGKSTATDPDLRRYRNERALSAVRARAAQAGARGIPRLRMRESEAETGILPSFDIQREGEEAEDPELAFVIQCSLDSQVAHETDDEEELEMEEVNIPGPSTNIRSRAHASQTVPEPRPLFDLGWNDEDDPELALALQHSLIPTSPRPRQPELIRPIVSAPSLPTRLEEDDDDLYAPRSRLETALTIAGATPRHREASGSMFGAPRLLASAPRSDIAAAIENEGGVLPQFMSNSVSSENEDTDMDEILIPEEMLHDSMISSTVLQEIEDNDDMEEVSVESLLPPARQISSTAAGASLPHQANGAEDMSTLHNVISPFPSVFSSSSSSYPVDRAPVGHETPASDDDDDMEDVTPPHIGGSSSDLISKSVTPARNKNAIAQAPEVVDSESDNDGDNEPLGDWSRSPSPAAGPSVAIPGGKNEETWDAAQEMDVVAEEGEFARFVSQVKGRNVETVRAEIDQEIKSLHQQRKAALRDSEDITQQMIAQIMLMLRLFGIPYITAPMEAEAQCAELVSLGLVEGIITDDSDVFLFGGQRVFKNMFNQSKTVECFFLSDLSRELGLDRSTLVRLAYLLGSDYVEGLPGVGPVVAMELLREFPGEDGLHKFKEWWVKVQSGKDRPEDNKSKFRRRFNVIQRDAYYHPTVDDSEEPFKWGMPDLDALRGFLREELGWGQTKVDDLLLPIIQKVAKRGQASALNKQGNLDNFLDVSTGGSAFAPRKRQAYSSKRLQEVVSEFRKGQRNPSVGASPAPASSSGSPERDAEMDTEGPSKKRRKTKGKGKARTDVAASISKKPPGRGRGRGRAAPGRKKAATPIEVESGDEDEEYVGASGDAVGFAPELRPRPKPRPAYKHKDNVEAHETHVEEGP